MQFKTYDYENYRVIFALKNDEKKSNKQEKSELWDEIDYNDRLKKNYVVFDANELAIKDCTIKKKKNKIKSRMKLFFNCWRNAIYEKFERFIIWIFFFFNRRITKILDEQTI